MIHYSQFAAHRASRVPLLGAIATLAVIAMGLGDPQAGVGTTAVAGMVTLDQPTISTPTALSGPRPDRPVRAEHLGVALFNRDRAAAGHPLLSESRALDLIAATRAQQMVADGLTHVRPGSTVMAVSQLLQQNGIAHTWDGENIYWMSGSSIDDAVSSAESWWMTSPEHRDNIVGSHFRQVGIGTAIGGAKIYVAAVFTD